MTNNELLLAMSDLLDQKLKAELQPVKDKLQNIDDRLQNVDGRLQIVEERLQDVDGRLQVVEVKLYNVEENVLRLNLCHENDILPRLNTIESCYTSTYNRYNSYAEKIDAAFTDINLLKIVVSDHSDKLQKLA